VSSKEPPYFCSLFSFKGPYESHVTQEEARWDYNLLIKYNIFYFISEASAVQPLS
jgi:hypothetical protein